MADIVTSQRRLLRSKSGRHARKKEKASNGLVALSVSGPSIHHQPGVASQYGVRQSSQYVSPHEVDAHYPSTKATLYGHVPQISAINDIYPHRTAAYKIGVLRTRSPTSQQHQLVYLQLQQQCQSSPGQLTAPGPRGCCAQHSCACDSATEAGLQDQ